MASELQRKPKDGFQYSLIEYVSAELDYYKARCAVAEEALKAVSNGIPAYINGSFVTIHFDGEGNEMGEEHHDPIAIIGYISGMTDKVLRIIAESE